MILGIDLGTSVVKAAAFDSDGEVLAVEGRRVNLYNPRPEYSEQDIDETLDALGEVVRTVVDRTNEPVEVIGLTGQGDGLWLLDEEGRPVRRAMTWLDARANPIVEEWMASGVFEEHYRKNGNITFPGTPSALMAALVRSEPESLERAATAGYCKDVVLHALTGERATDVSDASEPFMDHSTRDYDRDILKLFELEQYERLLAPIDPSPGQMRPLSRQGAELIGLPEGTPVHSGPFDLPATAMGAGIEDLGDGVIIVGTTLACEVFIDQVDTSGEPGGQTLCALEPDRWLRAMPAMVGTASMDLTLELFGSTHADIETFLAESPPGARGVNVLPFFSPSGERAPFVEPDARGQVAGMTLATTRADVVRAVCEAVGYAARHCLTAAGLEGEVAICGGGAESKSWRQVLADVLQKPLRIARRPEVGARGAAMAAMIGAGIDFDRTAWTRPEGHVEPSTDLADLYEEGFERYLMRVEAGRELWKRLRLMPPKSW
jgi:erythritol kinase (D-erythritol 1-phosphate-forming)